jgi:hypothetical protein
MLKYFYKTMLISILCGSLIMLDMSYKGGQLNLQVNTARAETLTTGGEKDGNLMATLTMVAVGYIASRLLMYGKVTPDIMVAAAGGLAYVAGNIAATSELKKVKDQIETEIKRSKTGDLTDQQRYALIRLKQMYGASLEAAETKQKLQQAAAVAFAAAAVIAYLEAGTEKAAEAVCTAAIEKAQVSVPSLALETCMTRVAGECNVIATAAAAACTVGAAACYAASYNSCYTATRLPLCNAQAASCTSSVSAITTSFPAYVALRAAPSLTCSALSSVNAERAALTASLTASTAGCAGTNIEFPPYAAAVQAACDPLLPMHIGYESGCLPPALLYAGLGASVAMMGITDATIIGLALSFSTTVATIVDTALFMPMRRAIMWGVLAGLTYASSSATAAVISQIQGDITKIDTLINTINAQSDGTTASSGSTTSTSSIVTAISGSNTNVSSGATSDIDLASTNSKLPCVTETDSSGKCTSFSSKLTSLLGSTSLPDSVKTTVTSLSRMADGLNGASKISASTMSTASSLTSNAVKNSLDKAKSDAISKAIGSNGEKTVAADEAKLSGTLKDALNSAIKKSNTSLSKLASSFNNGIPSGGVKDAASANAELNKAIAAVKATSAPVIALPAATSNANMAVSNVSDLKDENKTSSATAATASMDDYDLKNDISTDKSASLFDVISSRYQKSGYSRLFKKLSE